MIKMIKNYIYLFQSYIYNFDKTSTIIYPNLNTYNNDIEISLNPKIFQSKDITIAHTKTNRTKSKELVNNNKRKINNKSNEFKKINMNYNNTIKINYKEKINRIGNISIIIVKI